MELIKDTISVCDIKARGCCQAMADGDVIVPDVKPDILKLLQVDAQVCVTEKYIENGRLVVNGRVDYIILYVPESNDEKIKSIYTSMDFRQVVDSCGADADARLIVKPFVEKVDFDTVNSRKLRIRTIVNVQYEICELKAIEILEDVADENIEKKYNELEFESTVDVSEHLFTLNDKIEVPNGTESVNEILKTDVKIFDTEYKTVSGKVIIKGSTSVCILFTDTNGDVRFIESEIPFTEIIDSENINENTICDIDYCVIGNMCTVEPDNDGDLRVLNLDTDVCVTLKGTDVSRREVLADCFIPYKKTSCKREEIILKTSVERPHMQSALREVIELPKNLPGISGIYNVMANAIITKTQLQRNKIHCEGKIDVYVLYLTDSSENPVYSYKKDIPFSYMIDCQVNTEDLMCEMKSGVKHISYNLNSNGEVEIRCMLSIECVLTDNSVIDNICDIEVSQCPCDEGMIIYFAEKGEKVWDIAKKYMIPIDSLLMHNSLDEEAISDDTKLFIPLR